MWHHILDFQAMRRILSLLHHRRRSLPRSLLHMSFRFHPLIGLNIHLRMNINLHRRNWLLNWRWWWRRRRSILPSITHIILLKILRMMHINLLTKLMLMIKILLHHRILNLMLWQWSIPHHLALTNHTVIRWRLLLWNNNKWHTVIFRFRLFLKFTLFPFNLL